MMNFSLFKRSPRWGFLEEGKGGHPRGFMAIVAVGIFAVLMVFGLMLQRTTMQTYANIRNSNDHLSAYVISESAIEYLQFMLRDEDVGFNTSGDRDGTRIVCEFGEERAQGTTSQPTQSNDFCEKFEWIEEAHSEKDVRVVLEIKAHATPSENLVTNVTAFNWDGGVYTVPFPGTGDAGERCGMYRPVLGSGTATDANIPEHLLPARTDDTDTQNTLTSLDQIDFSCNWNKLMFGSALTDRVSLPLYYMEQDEDEKLVAVNPFEGNSPSARHFTLRLRTPCLPCDYEAVNNKAKAGHRPCTRGDDPTVCANTQRYTLTSGNENILVQWQLSGKCTIDGREQDCSMIAKGPYNSHSEISEWKLNQEGGRRGTNIILKKDTTGSNISVGAGTSSSMLTDALGGHPPFLPTLKEPVLTLFLSSALISQYGNVPYLEYQLITDKPVANNTTIMNVEVTVNGNSYKRTFEKPVRRPLIDYALQN